jgi:hypothetical protein
MGGRTVQGNHESFDVSVSVGLKGFLPTPNIARNWSLEGDQLQSALQITRIAWRAVFCQPALILKGQFQSELQVSGIKGAAGLSKDRAINLVVGQLKIGVVENIESFSPELQAEPVTETEALENRKVRTPKARADKGVTPQITHAGQTGRREKVVRQVETVSPLVV